MDYRELIERMRGFEIDHEPNGWPAIQMRDISAMCDVIESLLAENERLNAECDEWEANSKQWEQEYYKKDTELAKYRDASLLKEVYLINDAYVRIRSERLFAIDDLEYDLFSAGWKAAVDLIVKPVENK